MNKTCGFYSLGDAITMIVILSVVVFIAYIIVYTLQSVRKEKFDSPEHPSASTSSKKKVVGLFMPGCPYCVSFDGTFDSVTNALDKSIWSVQKITDTNEAVKTYSVNSFPTTIIIGSDGKEKNRRSGNMSKEEFETFISDPSNH